MAKVLYVALLALVALAVITMATEVENDEETAVAAASENNDELETAEGRHYGYGHGGYGGHRGYGHGGYGGYGGHRGHGGYGGYGHGRGHGKSHVVSLHQNFVKIQYLLSTYVPKVATVMDMVATGMDMVATDTDMVAMGEDMVSVCEFPKKKNSDDLSWIFGFQAATVAMAAMVITVKPPPSLPLGNQAKINNLLTQS